MFIERHNEGSGVQLERVEQRCAAHAALVDDAEVYGKVYAHPDSEQRRKNGLIAHLASTPAYGLHDSRTGAGESLDPSVTVSWSWVETPSGRDLVVNVSGKAVGQAHRTAIEGWARNQFGIGKVRLG
ncbi:MAG: hypothetical protein EKK62_09515 [Acidimicrobiia bacterium]|nr:MAG: hypothetical protein EKK62_09515 [Acidimicrobiia bacterium]